MRLKEVDVMCCNIQNAVKNRVRTCIFEESKTFPVMEIEKVHSMRY